MGTRRRSPVAIRVPVPVSAPNGRQRAPRRSRLPASGRLPFPFPAPSPFLFPSLWEHVLGEEQRGSSAPEVAAAAVVPLRACAITRVDACARAHVRDDVRRMRPWAWERVHVCACPRMCRARGGTLVLPREQVRVGACARVVASHAHVPLAPASSSGSRDPPAGTWCPCHGHSPCLLLGGRDDDGPTDLTGLRDQWRKGRAGAGTRGGGPGGPLCAVPHGRTPGGEPGTQAGLGSAADGDRPARGWAPGMDGGGGGMGGLLTGPRPSSGARGTQDELSAHLLDIRGSALSGAA